MPIRYLDCELPLLMNIQRKTLRLQSEDGRFWTLDYAPLIDAGERNRKLRRCWRAKRAGVSHSVDIKSMLAKRLSNFIERCNKL